MMTPSHELTSELISVGFTIVVVWNQPDESLVIHFVEQPKISLLPFLFKVTLLYEPPEITKFPLANLIRHRRIDEDAFFEVE
jgi:hypothetical protein